MCKICSCFKRELPTYTLSFWALYVGTFSDVLFRSACSHEAVSACYGSRIISDSHRVEAE